ncbi:MAG: aminotransferase class I/II-fold pyridoxal phosphate-dependent enzyme [Butyrivibrio sp.]|nr:aminotransferase class I/II-fold pyridoxal phosphate-dependent enzyme [Butyrivibrio sp.]
MLSFASDYTEGAHEKILQRFVETNLEQLPGYGSDHYCDEAKEKIKKTIEMPEADVWFLTGGTQTNEIVVDTMLAKYEGVISAVTGHISAHEAGAVEFNGHEVLTVPGYEGKLKAQDVRNYVRNFYADENHDHMVFPGMVYISYPTEYGTIYSKNELEEIYDVCKEYNMTLFVDGARLGYGLMCKECDITIKELARLCDVFYIGGTKVGALCGEAVVFTSNNTPKHFLTSVKQHGALLAKGRLLGIQFDTLFTDNLYFEISQNAIDRAEELRAALAEKNYKFAVDSPTNQIFVVVDNDKLKKLQESVSVGFWEKYDDNNTVIRFATSWATTKEQIETVKGII